MGERKGQSKYYPPDFDPTRLPAQDRTWSHKVRMMMPMSVQCITCAEYVYTGKKFNATIEPANEAYLGIKIWRLTVRCPRCSQAICLKTDPQNCDYICESGATRNFEPWRSYNLETAEMNAEREDARKDVMKDLEAKQYDAKKEMDALSQLDALVSRAAHRTSVTPEDLLTMLLDKGDEAVEFTPAEEAEIAKFKALQQADPSPAVSSNSSALPSIDTPFAAAPALPSVLPTGAALRKRKRRPDPPSEPTGAPAPAKKPVAPPPMGGLGLDYASDEAT